MKDLSRSFGLNYDRTRMALSIVTQLTLPLFWISLASGCATQTDEQAKRLSELNDRIGRLQTTNERLEERMSALEAAHRANVTKPTNLGQRTTVPQDLPVVKMTPPPATANEPTTVGSDTDEPRTLIVGEGSRVEARKSDEAPTGVTGKRNKDKAPVEAAPRKASGSTDTGKKTP